MDGVRRLLLGEIITVLMYFRQHFFTVEYGVIFLVIHSLTSGYNQSCLRALLSETYYYVL